MRSLYRWLILAIAIASMSGCCINCSKSRLTAAQTPVAIAGEQPVRVRPVRGGEVRRVLIPDGYLVAEPPPEDWQPAAVQRRTDPIR